MWSSTYIIWRQMKSRRRSPLINHQNAISLLPKVILKFQTSNSRKMTSMLLLNLSRRKMSLLRKGRFLVNKIPWANSGRCQIIPSILRRIIQSLLIHWKVRESAITKCNNPKKSQALRDLIICVTPPINFNAIKPWWISIPLWALRRVSPWTILTKSSNLQGKENKTLNQVMSLKKDKWKVTQRGEELFS